MRFALAVPLADLTEKEWQKQVLDLARMTTWKRSYHTFDSRRSAKGFPDMVLVRDRVLFIELKTEKGKPTPAQRDWLRDLLDAQAEVYLIRPRHLEQLALVLQARTVHTAAGLELRGELRRELDG